uniref:S1 motif domain-containing protein n=1 Tax=Rhizochromulina marina TaxID=1034831 RepID=A0A7S2RWS4_9STRA
MAVSSAFSPAFVVQRGPVVHVPAGVHGVPRVAPQARKAESSAMLVERRGAALRLAQDGEVLDAEELRRDPVSIALLGLSAGDLFRVEVRQDFQLETAKKAWSKRRRSQSPLLVPVQLQAQDELLAEQVVAYLRVPRESVAEVMPGQVVRAFVMETNLRQSSVLLSASRQYALSRRYVNPKVENGVHKRRKVSTSRPDQMVMLNELKTGTRMKGRVINFIDSGAFIDCTVYRKGQGGAPTSVHGFLYQGDLNNCFTFPSEEDRRRMKKRSKGKSSSARVGPKPVAATETTTESNVLVEQESDGEQLLLEEEEDLANVPMLEDGMELDVWIKSVRKQAGKFAVTLDSTWNSQSARDAKTKRDIAKQMRRGSLQPGVVRPAVVSHIDVDEGVLYVNVGGRVNAEATNCAVEHLAELSEGQLVDVQVVSVTKGGVELEFVGVSDVAPKSPPSTGGESPTGDHGE